MIFRALRGLALLAAVALGVACPPSLAQNTLTGVGSATSETIAPPPPLPLAVGARYMDYGHSFVSRGWFTGSSDGINLPLIQFASRMIGTPPWVRGIDQRYNVDTVVDVNAPNRGAGVTNLMNACNQGYAGGMLSDAINGAPYAASLKPDIVRIVYGINDILASRSTADITADFTTLFNIFRAKGIWTVAALIYPVAASRIPDGDPRLITMAEVNAWLRAQAGVRTGFRIQDTEAVFGAIRPNQPYWLEITGLHLQDRGNYADAVDLHTNVLSAMVSSGSYYNVDPTVSNLLTYTGYLGTAGSKTGITGNVATGNNAVKGTGTSTIVASKEVISGSFEKQVFTITPVNDGTLVHSMDMRRAANETLASLGLAVGDWVQFMQFFELSAWNGWVRAYFQPIFSTGTTTKQTLTVLRSEGTSGAQLLPTSGISFWAISDPFQIPSGFSIDTLRQNTTNTLLGLNWRSDVSGTGTIKVSKPILRKITDPRPAWNLNFLMRRDLGGPANDNRPIGIEIAA